MVRENVELEEKLEQLLLERDINPNPFLVDEEHQKIITDNQSYSITECSEYIIIEDLHLAIKKKEIEEIQNLLFKRG